MVNTHLCVNGCFSAGNSDKATISCYLCEKRFNAKCFDLSAQQTVKLLSSENNATFLCHKCIDRVNKLMHNTRKSHDATSASSMRDIELLRHTSLNDNQSPTDGNESMTSILSLLKIMDEKFSKLQESNSELTRHIFNTENNPTDTSDIKSGLTSINQNITNLHAKMDHNINERTTSAVKTHTLIIDKLNELHDKAFTSMNQATRSVHKINGLE